MLISSADGERTLVSNFGAAMNFRASHLENERCRAMLQSSGIVYVEGFLLTDVGDGSVPQEGDDDAAGEGVDAVRFLGEHCRQSSVRGDPKRFCVNLSADFICAHYTKHLAMTLPYVDILFGNESECVAAGRALDLGDDIPRICLALAAMPKRCGSRGRVVVITQGAEPTLVAVDGELHRYGVIPLARQSVVDLNGAGCAFVGGFLSQMLLGRSIADAVHAGHWAARVVIQRSGCSLPEQCDYA